MISNTLQDLLEVVPEEWWDPYNEATRKVHAIIADGDDTVRKSEPLVNTIQLLYSTYTARRIWQLPLYDFFKDTVEPLLWQVIGKKAVGSIIRLQLSRLQPGAAVKQHTDQGVWAAGCALQLEKPEIYMECMSCTVFFCIVRKGHR